MAIMLLRRKKDVGRNGHRPRRAVGEMAQTLSVVSQVALLCPSGMDIWAQRELCCFEQGRHGAAPRR